MLLAQVVCLLLAPREVLLIKRRIIIRLGTCMPLPNFSMMVLVSALSTAKCMRIRGANKVNKSHTALCEIKGEVMLIGEVKC